MYNAIINGNNEIIQPIIEIEIEYEKLSLIYDIKEKKSKIITE